MALLVSYKVTYHRAIVHHYIFYTLYSGLQPIHQILYVFSNRLRAVRLTRITARREQLRLSGLMSEISP